MGKRRKAIRWLVTIVIVALIGGVTAVAVDRRIREQVEELQGGCAGCGWLCISVQKCRGAGKL